MYYIYGLVDPDSLEIKYVGQTKNPENRFKQHLKIEIENRKVFWIANLKRKGKKPILQIIEKIETKRPDFHEKKWINYFNSIGIDLFNTVNNNKDKSNPIEISEVIEIDKSLQARVKVDELKTKYVRAFDKLDFAVMNCIKNKLYYFGWIPVIRDKEKIVWKRILNS